MTDAADPLLRALRVVGAGVGTVASFEGIVLRDGVAEAARPDAKLVIALPSPLRAGWLRVDVALAPRSLPLKVDLLHAGGGATPVPLARLGPGRYLAAVVSGLPVTGIALLPMVGHQFGGERVALRAFGRRQLVASALRRLRDVAARGPSPLLAAFRRVLARFRSRGDAAAFSPDQPAERSAAADYADWRAVNEAEPAAERAARLTAALAVRPAFTLLLPWCSGSALAGVLHALRTQPYPDWRLCLMTAGEHDGSAPTGAPDDARVAVVRSGSEAVSGWAVLLAPGALPRPHALATFAAAIAADPGACVLYADEDRLDGGSRQDPFFKPGWSPDFFRASGYAGGMVAVSADVLRAAGGWRADLYDLLLQASEAVPAAAIRHVPEILHHRTDGPGMRPSAAALAAHYRRIGCRAEVEPVNGTPYLRSRHPLPSPSPLVSMIVPMKDNAALTARCLGSVLGRSTYPRFEVLLVDNGSVEPESAALFEALRAEPRVRVLRYERPFNFSAINNMAAASAAGSVLVLLNNDVEVITPDWLEELVGQALRPEIGCVGAMLFYPDDRIQHAGVVLGVGGLVAHAPRFAPRGSAGSFGRLRVAREASAVTAACLALRRELYERVGGLDAERFAVTYNDIDLCLRVRALGLRNLWTPFAELTHHESVSRGSDDRPENRARFLREAAAFAEAWGDALRADPYYSPHLSPVRDDWSLRTD